MDIYQFNFHKQIINNNSFEFGTVLLLGEFEFFHNGHLKLLEEAKKYKENYQIGILVIDKKEKQRIQSLKLRLENLANMGFDFAIVCDFNFEFKSLDGKDFINYLDQNFNVKKYIVGEDFRFGKDRKYNVVNFKNITKANVLVIDFLTIENQKISSSRIMQMIEFGEFNLLKNLLPNPIQIDIKIFNKKIVWLYNLKPHFGIYYFKILIDDYWYHGIVHFSIKGKINFRLVNYKKEFIFDQNSIIEILDVQRIITNTRYDEIFNQDFEEAQNYFSY